MRNLTLLAPPSSMSRCTVLSSFVHRLRNSFIALLLVLAQVALGLHAGRTVCIQLPHEHYHVDAAATVPSIAPAVHAHAACASVCQDNAYDVAPFESAALHTHVGIVPARGNREHKHCDLCIDVNVPASWSDRSHVSAKEMDQQLIVLHDFCTRLLPTSNQQLPVSSVLSGAPPGPCVASCIRTVRLLV